MKRTQVKMRVLGFLAAICGARDLSLPRCQSEDRGMALFTARQEMVQTVNLEKQS